MDEPAEAPEEIHSENPENTEHPVTARDVDSEEVGELMGESFSQEPPPPDADYVFPVLPEPPLSSGEDEDPEDPTADDEDPEESEDSNPAILRIDESLLARVSQVFVKPPGYSRSIQAFIENIANNYVFIIHGDEHTGKLTCALHLAQELLGRREAEKRIYYYRRRPDESLSLLDFARQEDVKHGRIYILEDAFPGISREDLETQFLHHLNEKLHEKQAFLLLTTEMPARELPAGVATISAAGLNLQMVFLKHLDLYETNQSAVDRVRIERPVLDLARESWELLRDSFRDPDQIDEFCRRLGVRGGLPDADELRHLAQEIGLRRIEAARPWFGRLLPHEKLFAFLIALFPRCDGQVLYEIFLSVVAKLRDQGMNLLDPRRIGYHDLLDRVRAVEGPTRELDFHERVIGFEVEWQIRNYNFLLWSLVPWFIEEIQKAVGPEPEAWEIRRSRALAVGRVGLHSPARLCVALEKLASHPSNGVAAAVGHTFAAVCSRSRDADQEVLDALRGWLSSGNPRLLWTAGSCIWQVYGALQRSSRDSTEMRATLFELLEELITLSDTPGSALFAIKKIAAVDSKGMAERLQLWLTEGEPDLRRASQLAIRGLFESSGEPGGRKRRPALIELVGPVLAHCGEGSKVTAALFSAMAKWLDDPEAIAVLLQVANRLTGRAARAFRSGLSPWLENPSPQVRRLGGMLLTRSLILEGAAVPALSSFKGALVLDSSRAAQADANNEAVARRIWNLLQPRLDLRLVRMGEARELAGPGQLFPSRFVLTNGSRPRLLLPAVDSLAEDGLCVVIVLTTGQIVDLEEASIAAWSGGLLLAHLGRTGPELSLPEAVRIDPWSPAAGLAELAARLDDRFAAAIASAGALGDEVPETTLLRWIHELDQPSSLKGPADLAVAVLQAVLGLAAADLDRCSALLSSWMAPDRSDLELRLGAAATRLLLRTTAHRSSSSGPERDHLFHLATALAACGTEGLETAFSAIRHWLPLQEWAETLLNPNGEEPGLLLQWLATLQTERLDLFKRRLADWRRSPGDEPSDAARRLTTAVERIEEWIVSRAGDPQGEEPATAPEPPPTPASRREPPPARTTDPLGFPMVWIEEIDAFLHWLPVTKLQFERFLAATTDALFDDAWYRHVLDVNPRVAVQEISSQNYGNAFLTGILPEEARRFAAWCGQEYSLPNLEEWQKAFAALAAVPAASAEISNFGEGAGELVRSTLVRIESASVASLRPDRQRTRADQMLMRLGVLEWVEQTAGTARWGGMGEPSPHFRTLWSVGRGAVNPLDTDRSRSPAFGFRLIRRMDPTRFTSQS